MEHAAAVAGDSQAAGRFPDLPVRSPWIAQLAPLGDPRPLDEDVATDVAIIGAGIAGIATAFFALRSTDHSVLVLERDRVAHGASGRNAGQLTTYFERPLHDIAAQFGDDLAIEGQRAFDDAHDLLDLLVAEAGATVRVERFTGHMGMFTLNHVMVHLRNNRLRLHGGLRVEPCVVSEEAAFLDEIPAEFAELYTVVPQARIRELLETDDDRYRAVLSDRKGCANSAMLCQQVLALPGAAVPRPAALRRPDRGGARRRRPGRRRAAREPAPRARGARRALHQRLHPARRRGRGRDAARAPSGAAGRRHLRLHGGVRGGAAAHARCDELHPQPGGRQRRGAVRLHHPAHLRPARRRRDAHLHGRARSGRTTGSTTRGRRFPGRCWTCSIPRCAPSRSARGPAGQPYDFHWHGLMGYMDGMVRVIGPHPGRPSLLYNLGCNGVGFLPSIHGGRQIARLLGGEQLPRSIFDPR